MKKILKIIIYTVLVIVTVFVLTAVIFTNFSPQLGKKINTDLIQKYSQSSHWKNKSFTNLSPTSLDIKLKEIPGLIIKVLTDTEGRSPAKNIEVVATDISKKVDAPRITWFGHSTFLLEITNKNILIDPMFGQVAAPHKWLGNIRYNKELPISIKDLPPIDAVIISHDHYDHLDYESIKSIKEKVNKFFVPLGVARHLESWGIKKEKIVEHDWWQATILDELQITFAPARHFSGRGFLDRDTTFWGSWAIKSPQHNLFFSGDSGYGKHFSDIGNKLGPFDFSMIESGQYDQKWTDIHMFPEQSVQAAVDLNTQAVMPIHWGTFSLAYHKWTEPIERFLEAAKKTNLLVVTPQIGESVVLNKKMPQKKWWKLYE